MWTESNGALTRDATGGQPDEATHLKQETDDVGDKQAFDDRVIDVAFLADDMMQGTAAKNAVVASKDPRPRTRRGTSSARTRRGSIRAHGGA
jgi:hypothetical protein